MNISQIQAFAQKLYRLSAKKKRIKSCSEPKLAIRNQPENSISQISKTTQIISRFQDVFWIYLFLVHKTLA